MSTPSELLKQALNFQNSGDLIAAEKLYKKLLLHDSDNADAANLLGCLLMDRGNFQEAEKLIQKAIDLKSDIYFFYYHLGLLYSKQSLWNKAIVAFRNALSYNSGHVDSLNNLGVALNGVGDDESAIFSFEQALKYDSTHSAAYNNIAAVYLKKGNLEKAQQYCMKAIDYSPEKPEYHKNIAGMYRKHHQLERAEHHLKLALTVAPDYIQALNDYGVILKDQGKNMLAYETFCQLVEQQENFVEAQSNRLFLLHFLQEKTPEFIFEEHVSFGKKFSHHQIRSKSIHKPQNKRIRIGYVSPDFRHHSVSFFIKPILKNHNPENFEIFCYANVSKPDHITLSLQSFNVHWRNIYEVSDNNVCKQIEKDHIDILVDLAGHSANNRLMIFAHKPAPIQMTYLGYPNTTGLPTVDYRITDAITDPQETNHLYVEKLIYLEPCFLCYSPPDETPIHDAPLSNPVITFGSFNSIGKLNDDVVGVWATILKTLPESRLILKSSGFTGIDTQNFWRKKFMECGVKDQQLIFLGYIPNVQDHLAAYQSIDIALDTFPYNGTTTTFEALWMGIPVIALSGKSHVSRVGCSILNALGLNDLIAQSREDYTAKAIYLALNPSLLKALSKQLRTMLKQSVLTDGHSFTRQLEQKFQKILKEQN
ncbi:MAG: tetratricopeptide repeat protein [Candidatus Magnetomorum sp.]|nr:tetratricopeptide repeat protein [Candidatus Magnetomorum sp.]